MHGFTVKDAQLACGGRLSAACEEEAALGRIVIDSREVCPGDLFVAYRGERVDGHDFISAALDRGAACCLAERLPEGERRCVLLVPDVQRALEQIAAAWRARLSLPVIGVTGSVGKTTAKEMLAAVLESRFQVLKTEGNLNNRIGVPMTLSRITPEHELAVVEMGISEFGEMRALTQMARPDIAVFTVIGHAHLEFLHDLDGVLRAKAELLEGMPADGLVVINGEDPYLQKLRCRQRLLRVGFTPEQDLWAREIEMDPREGTRCRIVCGARELALRIPAFGRHVVQAALLAAAVGMHMGLTDEEIARGVLRFQNVHHRAAVIDTGSLTLIDDSYNANPDSVRCGIDSLMALPGRHVCVLGDMLELGEDSARMHEEIGRYAREQGVDALWSYGAMGEAYCRGAGGIGRLFADRQALSDQLPELLREGDAVLVKASKGMRFWELAEQLRALGEKKS